MITNHSQSIHFLYSNPIQGRRSLLVKSRLHHELVTRPSQTITFFPPMKLKLLGKSDQWYGQMELLKGRTPDVKHRGGLVMVWGWDAVSSKKMSLDLCRKQEKFKKHQVILEWNRLSISTITGWAKTTRMNWNALKWPFMRPHPDLLITRG